jgi:hypothetical protein
MKLKLIEYIVGWIVFLFIMVGYAKWAGHVVASEDWIAFIVGFVAYHCYFYKILIRKKEINYIHRINLKVN